VFEAFEWDEAAAEIKRGVDFEDVPLSSSRPYLRVDRTETADPLTRSAASMM
jgi:hypothetical protein